MHSEDDKPCQEDKKRRLKTPSQVEALEKFYNEHKYPSELLKSEFSGKIGLSEKQISRWFCHRRLKDKNRFKDSPPDHKRLKDDACVTGKQDLSSSFLQDCGSGHRQDSCGSTKQGDYRHFDPREVESQRFYGQDYSSAVLSSEKRGQHMNPCDYGTDSDTSSGSSSDPQEKLLPSRYSSWDSNSLMMNTKGVEGRGYMMASKYLYLQDEIENPAISAVKKQLGRHYRPDGPPIGVEFQPLPPGAFDSPLGDSTSEPYYVGHPSLQNSHGIPRVKNEVMVHDMHRYKSQSHCSYSEEAGSRRTMKGPDNEKEYTRYSSAQRPFSSHKFHGPHHNSAMEIDGDFAGEASELISNSYKAWPKNSAEVRSISSKGNLRLYEGKTSPNKLHYSQLRNDHLGPRDFQKHEYESGTANLALKHKDPLNTDHKFPSRKMSKIVGHTQEKRLIEPHKTNEPLKIKRNEKNMGKRLKSDQFLRVDSKLKMPSHDQPRANSIKGSAMEMPTSFSEDETASSGSSV